jgi:hypothetical protein
MVVLGGRALSLAPFLSPSHRVLADGSSDSRGVPLSRPPPIRENEPEGERGAVQVGAAEQLSLAWGVWVRVWGVHFIIEMIRWTGLVPWKIAFPFPGSLASAFLGCVHVGAAKRLSQECGASGLESGV